MPIPYPRVGSFTKTCVTAPTMRPSCKIGLPDMPCTMPPVRAIRPGSVTCTTMERMGSPPSGATLSISQS